MTRAATSRSYIAVLNQESAQSCEKRHSSHFVYMTCKSFLMTSLKLFYTSFLKFNYYEFDSTRILIYGIQFRMLTRKHELLYQIKQLQNVFQSQMQLFVPDLC